MPEYRELVRLYHETVFRVAKGVVRDAAAAEDVTQEVFLSLLENPAPVERAENPRAYICRMALNRALDARRAGRRRADHEARTPERRPAMDPVESAFRREVRERVAELPEELRQPVDLHYFQGLSLREAGLALEIPEGTVSSRISSALQRLRAALAGAAFAALLASLESELSQCAAGEPVPGELTERLLKLRPRRGPSDGGGRPARQAARRFLTGVALLLAMAVGVPTAVWAVRRNQEDSRATAGAGISGSETAAGPAAGASTMKNGGKPGATQDPPVEPPAEKPSEMKTQGFLYASPDGPRLGRFRWELENPLAPEPGQFSSTVDGSILLKSGGALAGLPVTGGDSFLPFLNGACGPEGAPQARVSVNLVFPAGEKVPPDPAEVERVIEAELLPPAWLESWREMVGAYREIRETCSTMEPGLRKRARVLELASALSGARDRARAAREGLEVVRWKLASEGRVLSGVVAIVSPFGLEDALPKWPTSSGLVTSVLDAPTPQALRTSLVDRWGRDVLQIEIEYARKIAPGDPRAAAFPEGREPGWTEERALLQDLCGLGQDEFAARQARIRAGRESLSGHVDEKAVEELAVVLGATGLSARPLDDIDRQRLVLRNGVRVVAVEAGSIAEQCGFRAGDVIWTVFGPDEMFQGSNAVLKEMLDPTILGMLVESAQKQGLGLELGVAREEGAVRLILKP
ncbi:MAG: sigma-70 family RNA polymerase sigma factor [Planctomycetes bacterium]|nr:sigma-70 family RNA polymerase sigma factor [Planctomycetota bacterium]